MYKMSQYFLFKKCQMGHKYTIVLGMQVLHKP